MTESLKFGPEWLRTCSGTSNSVTANNSAPRYPYPLSEFRYGREEMLALFDKNIKHPEILPRYKNLFVEKMQCPLALTPSAEDDQVAARMWPMRSSPGLSVRGGRGGIMDRGRGRGRGAYHSVSGGGFSRPSLFPDEDGGRILGGRGERWVERNGTDPGEWASGLQSTSPRKEYTSHGRGTSIESWRRPRGDEEVPLEQWRSGSLGPREPTKWGRSTSWREEDSSLAESRAYNTDRGYPNAAMERPNSLTNRALHRRPWEVPEDNLPEWAVDNPLESGGSFDATGAFHGSDDEMSPENSARLDKHNFAAKSSRDVLKELNGVSGPSHVDDEEGGQMLGQRSAGMEKEMQGEGVESKMNDTMTAAGQHSPSSSGGISMRGQPIGATGLSESESGTMAALLKGITQVPNVDRMQEVADDMVEKLIMDDELTMGREKDKPLKMGGDDSKMAGAAAAMKASAINDTEWFYRDPQDMVQGPFSAVEMAEWYHAGYFDNSLCVRRKNDQRFAKLGELIEMCGGEMPFFVPYRSLLGGGPSPVEAQPMKVVPPILPHRLNNTMMDMDPNIDPRVLRQNYITRQHAIAYQKLSTSDMWHMLNPEQQRQMIAKHVAQMPVPDSIYGLQQAAIAAGDANMTRFGLFDGLLNKPPPPLDGSGPGVENALLQQNMLAAKKMQNMIPPGGLNMPMMPPIPQDFPPVLNPSDPMNQLMHNMRIFPQMPPTGNAAENDRIKSLLMQLSMQKGMQPQPGGPALSQIMMSQQHLQQKPGMVPWPFAGGDPLKGAQQGPLNMGGGNTAGQGVGSNWMGLDGPGVGAGGPGAMDLGRPNNSSAGGIWELEHKLFSNASKPIEMKTEKQIIEEQQMAMLQKEKEMELDEQLQQQQQQQHQQMNQHQLNQQLQAVAAADQLHQMRENDNKGWTKVESKATVGKMDLNQKDKKNSDLGDKNAKKKDTTTPSIKPGVQQQQQPQKKEELQKKPVADIKQKELAGAQKVKSDGKTVVANNGSNNSKSQSAKGGANSAKSVAPWSINQPLDAPGLSLAEIQKLELEQQRAEQSRMDHILQQQQQQWFDIQNLKADLPKWNAPQLAPSVVKSLAEIQAEEQAKLRQWQETAAATAAVTQAPVMVPKKVVEDTSNAVWGSTKAWNSNGPPSSSSMGGFWEEPVKSVSSTQQAPTVANRLATGGKTIAKSQTMSNIQTKSTAAVNTQATKGQATQKSAKATAGAVAPAAASSTGGASTNGTAKKETKVGKGNKKDDASGQEFTQWCTKALSAYNSTIDIPTFVSFLQDIESPYEVKDYIRVYLGETKECADFCKQFLERRSKYKNQIRAQNAHVDDMCSPAPALTPSLDFQEGKAKKVKKNKMMKLDSRILGFSVTAAQDRINVGDRDYPNAS